MSRRDKLREYCSDAPTWYHDEDGDAIQEFSDLSLSEVAPEGIIVRFPVYVASGKVKQLSPLAYIVASKDRPWTAASGAPPPFGSGRRLHAPERSAGFEPEHIDVVRTVLIVDAPKRRIVRSTDTGYVLEFPDVHLPEIPADGVRWTDYAPADDVVRPDPLTVRCSGG